MAAAGTRSIEPHREPNDGEGNIAGAPATSAAIENIPRQELTPAVSAALAALEAENISLRKDLDRMRSNFENLERMADRDPHLPVLNRRAFLREFSRVKSFIGRYSGDASLIFIDLDHLKELNDEFGHAAGDLALQIVADVLRAQIRESDVAGRLGGDEFGVILVNASPEQATAKARSFEEAVARKSLLHDGRPISLSVSSGIWSIDAASDIDSILARADEAMYEHKRGKTPG